MGHGAAKGDGGIALGGNHKHSEIPKQGDSGAREYPPRLHMPLGLKKTAPARPKSRGCLDNARIEPGGTCHRRDEYHNDMNLPWLSDDACNILIRDGWVWLQWIAIIRRRIKLKSRLK